MIRLFQTHKIREIRELEGNWDFQSVDSTEDAGGNTILSARYNYRLPVPGCWEMHPKFGTYRGKGEYRTKVRLDQSSSVRLTFKGVSHTAEVFWNGIKVADHYNAYTPFSAINLNAEAGEHEIIRSAKPRRFMCRMTTTRMEASYGRL